MGNIISLDNLNNSNSNQIISFSHTISKDIDIFEPLKDLVIYGDPKEIENKVFNDPQYYKYQEYLNIYGLKHIDDAVSDYVQEATISTHFYFDTFSEYLNTIIVSSNPQIKVPILIEIRKDAFYLYYQYPYDGVVFTEQEKANAPSRHYVKYSSTFYMKKDNEFSGTPITLYTQIKYANILIDDFINSKFNNKPSKYII